jgi:NAD(P)-dependent dehydrogenase (short-subunit alcohol dehydrogenase family)
METGLAGRSVLITGASRGIGRAAALGFAAEGCALHLAGRNETDLRAVAAQALDQGAKSAQVHTGDLLHTGEPARLARTCGEIDVLVTNAGATPTGPIETVTESDWQEGLGLKVISTALLIGEVYRSMCQRGSGVIVNVIGNCGERPDPEIIIGTVCNAGMMNFTRALGADSPRHGVRVLGVNPGPTATERLIMLMERKAADRLGDAKRWTDLTAPLPFGRAATPEEIANMIVFGASDRASFVSGTVLTVDGGVAWRGGLF